MLNRSRLSLVKRTLSQSRPLSAIDTKNDSYAFGLMQGEVYPKHMFPYPNNLNEEERENLEMMVDPTDAVSSFKNTAIHNCVIFAHLPVSKVLRNAH